MQKKNHYLLPGPGSILLLLLLLGIRNLIHIINLFVALDPPCLDYLSQAYVTQITL